MYRFLEGMSLLQMIFIFLIVVFIWSLLFYYFTPGMNGIHCTTSEQFNYGSAVYFSIVTISSLGYGDLQPMGWSRFFATIEVIIGLVLMGMLVAKFTSSRMSYHAKRLYASDSAKQISNFTSMVSLLFIDFTKFQQTFSASLSDTPLQGTENYETLIDRARRQFANNLLSFSKNIEEFKSYLVFEIQNGDFLSEIPLKSVSDCGKAIDELTKEINSFLIGIPDRKRSNLLFGTPGKHFKQVVEEIVEVCILVNNNCKDGNMKSQFSLLKDQCDNIRDEILLVTVSAADIEYPNSNEK